MTLRATALLLATVCLGAYGCTGRSEGPAVVAVDAPDTERERTIRSVYIEMPDGVRLASDIWFPQGVDASARLPALVSFTRYWRARAFDPPMPDPPPIVEAANDAGYAVVIVDARGSGASFGSRAAEFSTCETRDFRFVIDWIAAEAWSNGRVATFGVSYTGNTAEHATFDPAAALAAAVPRFTDFDAYKDILMPGGLRNTLISGEWGRGVRALDENRVPEGEWRSGSKDGARLLGVAPVGDGRLLAEAITQHAANQDLVAWLSTFEYRDDLQLASGIGDDCSQIVSPYRFLHDADRPSIPANHWGSWMDAGTAAGIIARFAAAKGHGSYVIGPWSHGATFDADVFKPEDSPVSPGIAEQHRRIFEFLAPHLKPENEAAPAPAGLAYFTMGDGWKFTDRWPPAGSREVLWHVGMEQSLRREPSAVAGHDRYAVDFSAGTGSKSRWTTQLGGGDVFYGDRRQTDRSLLTYTSAPLEDSIEVTGHPVVRLFVASTHEDGALIAYLEAVAPDGSVLMITEGQLRVIHREVSAERPPYPQFGPYHSFKREDAKPLVPGEITEIAFAMLPTSVRIPEGYAIRLAIAGHDKDVFARYPPEGDPVLELYFGGRYPSSLMLPVVNDAALH